MNTPFRHRSHDERAARGRAWDDDRYEARDAREDERRSWREEDPYQGRPPEGRYAQGWRDQGWRDQDYGEDVNAGHGRWAGPFARWRGWEPDFRRRWESDERRRYGQDRLAGSDYGPHDWRSRTYPRHAYAPGSQIWDSPGVGDEAYGAPDWGHDRDFEPDYLHWRNEQIRNFDRDYHQWRTERRQKFSTDFASWRQSKPKDRPHNEAANPFVGDVSDGGDGDKGRTKL